MSLIQGSSGDYPCNICVVYKDKQHEMNEEYRLRTSAWSQELYDEAKKLSSASSQNEFLKPYGLRFVEVNLYHFKYV